MAFARSSSQLLRRPGPAGFANANQPSKMRSSQGRVGHRNCDFAFATVAEMHLRHIRVWGCPAHVLKGKTDKLEARTDVCVFVGYPKGKKGGLFYCPKEKKVIVSTNAKFLEEDYLMNHVPRSKLVLQELSKGVEPQSSDKQNDQMQTPEVDIDIQLHFSSGRNVNRHDVPQEKVPEVILPQSSGSYIEQIAQQEEVVDIPVDSMKTQVPDDDVVQPQNQKGIVTTDVVHSRGGREIRQPVRYTILKS
ncbi:PREDICTED: uncharacterized protein LOC109219094 [Nicotiana attenuata]|uniref:uncharacterized protein LOC109219094 n=1 Tax=Nicotiana attenuata TaxID=49451 RepID=UPI0009052ECC|nr:PREDICTED: uncharacterized protein LOC109219094 [Nicotiana attenuata]